MDSKTARYLARNPRAMMKYRATGKAPQLRDPKSPLITLLEQIAPRDRAQIIGVRLSPTLGYRSGARFRTAAALYRWLVPAVATESVPSESHQDKRFAKRLSITDLEEHCSHMPQPIKAEWERRYGGRR